MAKVKEVKLGQEFEYNGTQYQTVYLTMDDDIEYAWGKITSWPIPIVGDTVSFEKTGDKSKEGKPKIKSVKVIPQRTKSYNERETEKIDIERQKQINISRSVALKEAVAFVNMTKNVSADDPCFQKNLVNRVINVAHEFTKFLVDGEVPEYSPIQSQDSRNQSIPTEPLRKDSDGDPGGQGLDINSEAESRPKPKGRTGKTSTK